MTCQLTLWRRLAQRAAKSFSKSYLMSGLLTILVVASAANTSQAWASKEPAKDLAQSVAWQYDNANWLTRESACAGPGPGASGTDSYPSQTDWVLLAEANATGYARQLTDSGYIHTTKPIKDIQVGDEVLARDEMQAHDNAQSLAVSQKAHLSANSGIKSADSATNTGASGYENESNLTLVAWPQHVACKPKTGC